MRIGITVSGYERLGKGLRVGVLRERVRLRLLKRRSESSAAEAASRGGGRDGVRLRLRRRSFGSDAGER